MKRGYRNLLILELVIFLVLILNSFVSNILSNYRMVLFLLIIIGIFHFFLRFEKDRHRYTKDIILEEVIFLIMFFLLYYISGIFLSFARVDNYYTFHSLINIIIPIIVTILLKEFLRYQMLLKSEGRFYLFS